MISPPLVALIVLNWNNWQDTLACVESCRRLTWPNFRIIIVDNGSGDDSEAQLRRHCPDAEVIQTGTNLGFAGGNNVRIRHALSCGAEFVWLLNNDAIAAPDALDALVSALLDDRDAGCAGSKIYYLDQPDRIWSAGSIWEKGRLRLRQRGAGQEDRGQFDLPQRISAVSGCSMLMRAETLGRVGFLDEKYFLYWEDIDWCARAAAANNTALYVPASRVWHKVSTSVTPRSQMQYYYYTRNGLLFCSRHDLRSLPLLLLYTGIDALSGLLRGNTGMMLGFCRAVGDFLAGRRGRRDLA